MAEKGGYDQRGQNFSGNQTNVNEANSPVFTGDVGVVNVNAQEKPPTPNQIPLPPQDFTGREDVLSELAGLFERDKVIVGIRGMGGVGKSALAFALAERLNDHFPDGKIFVSMMGTSTKPLTSADAMAQVIRSYSPDLCLPEKEAELANLYRSVLEGKRTLLLLDNALDYSQASPLLPPAKCSLIVTSRRKFNLPGMIPKDLDVLKLNKGVELLLSTAGGIYSGGGTEKKAAWEGLARLCGCLPVALRAAGSFLANSLDSSPEQYARELQDEKRRLERIGKEGVEEGLDLKLSLSYSRLPAETAQVFRHLSIFPSDFDSKAEEVICLDEGHRHLSELLRWSLIEFQRPRPEAEGRYHLHDLVRLFAIGLMEKEEDEPARNDARQRHSEHFRNVLSLATDLYEKGSVLGGLGIFDLERANIESAWEWAEKNLSENNEAASICSSFLNWPYLLSLRLHPQDLISRLKTALAAARKLNDRGMEGAHLGNLGIAYKNLGDVRKAIEFYQQALPIAREIGDRRGEGSRLGNLGNAYYLLGEPSKAIEYHEKALAIDQEIGNRWGEGADLGNLGAAYAALGETRQAIEYHEQALAIDREIGDQRGEGAELGNLGAAYAALGEPRKAIEFHEQALKISREIGDRRGEGSALGNLGLAFSHLGELRKAIEFYKQALDISQEIGYLQGEAADLGNLGSAYLDLGETRKAIEFSELALAQAREIADKQNESEFLRNLGKAYLNLKENEKAIGYSTKSLDLARSIEFRKSEGEGLCTLGKVFVAQDEPQKALDHCDQALKIFQDIEYPKGEAEALFAKSQALHQLGQHEEAAKCAQQALAIFQRIESHLAEKVRQQLAEWGSSEES